MKKINLNFFGLMFNSSLNSNKKRATNWAGGWELRKSFSKNKTPSIVSEVNLK